MGCRGLQFRKRDRLGGGLKRHHDHRRRLQTEVTTWLDRILHVLYEVVVDDIVGRDIPDHPHGRRHLEVLVRVRCGGTIAAGISAAGGRLVTALLTHDSDLFTVTLAV